MDNNNKEKYAKIPANLIGDCTYFSYFKFLLGMFILPLSSFTLRTLQFINVIIFGVLCLDK